MRHKDRRALVWLGSILAFFPLWIGAMYALDAAFGRVSLWTGQSLPGWFQSTLFFLSVPAVLLPVSYVAAGLVERRYPVGCAGSASWDQQGNRSAADRGRRNG